MVIKFKIMLHLKADKIMLSLKTDKIMCVYVAS